MHTGHNPPKNSRHDPYTTHYILVGILLLLACIIGGKHGYDQSVADDNHADRRAIEPTLEEIVQIVHALPEPTPRNHLSTALVAAFLSAFYTAVALWVIFAIARSIAEDRTSNTNSPPTAPSP